MIYFLNLSDDMPKKYLYHNSDLGEFNLTSDAITNEYRNTVRMKNIINQISKKCERQQSLLYQI